MIDLLRNTPDLNSPEAGHSPNESEQIIHGQEGQLEGQEGGAEHQGYEAQPGSSEQGNALEEEPAAAGQQYEQSQVETFVPAPEAVLNETPQQIEDETGKLLTGENRINPADSSTAKALLDILNGGK
ncbi:hypothetical protein IPM19_01330 [bacterium]|nr:MAG: hypothetical protein IPM19_01330 [bacterium]